MHSTPRHFAIIPAAGHSTRMGRPKLLLPLDGQPLIKATIAAWKQSRVAAVLVVVRPGDLELSQVCSQAGATVIVPPIPPPDMKASILAAVEHIGQHLKPTEADALLVAPADMPRLSPAIINRLIEQHLQHAVPAILAPAIAGKRGHPVVFPWRSAADLSQLGPDQGLNVLVDRGPLTLIACDDLAGPGDAPFADIDTPADYERLR